MLKGVVVGIILGVLLVAGSVYLYFALGHAPVATSAADMPFEGMLARKALHAYLDKLPHPQPAVSADESDLVEGAKVYVEHCATCHGLPDHAKTFMAEGMYPRPPQLFRGMGVTDDEPWETYWKVEGGIRMTGMPGFRGLLSETQIWQVTQLVKNADKLDAAVKGVLTPAPAMSSAAPAAKTSEEKPATKPH
jgi:thiosulfate dehydrogenase